MSYEPTDQVVQPPQVPDEEDQDEDDVFADPTTDHEVVGLSEQAPDDDNDDQMGDLPTPPSSSSSSSPPNNKDNSSATIDIHRGPVYSLSVLSQSSTSIKLVSGGGDDVANYTTLDLNTLQGPHQFITLANHTESVSSTAISKDATMIATGDFNGTIQLWDATKNCQVLRQLEGPSSVEDMKFHPRGNVLLVSGGDGTIWMYLAATGAIMQVFIGHSGAVSRGRFAGAGGRWVVSTGAEDGTLRVWDPRSGKNVCAFGNGNGEETKAGEFQFNSGGGGLFVLDCQEDLLAAGGEDGCVYVCNLPTEEVANTGQVNVGKCIAKLEHSINSNSNSNSNSMTEGEEGSNSIEAIAFAPKKLNMKFLATGGVDGTMKIWDLSRGKPILRVTCVLGSGEVEGEGEGGEEVTNSGLIGVTDIVWHESLPIVFVGGSDGVVRAYDARSQANKPLAKFEGHEIGEMLNSMVVVCGENGGEDFVITGSDDHKIKVFKVASTKLIQ